MMSRAQLTDEQVSRTLEMALGWRACSNMLAAKIRLSALRKRLRGAQLAALDNRLKSARFLREVLEADEPVARTAYGAMPSTRNGGRALG